MQAQQAQSAAQLAAASAPPGSMVVVQHPNGMVELLQGGTQAAVNVLNAVPQHLQQHVMLAGGASTAAATTAGGEEATAATTADRYLAEERQRATAEEQQRTAAVTERNRATAAAVDADDRASSSSNNKRKERQVEREVYERRLYKKPHHSSHEGSGYHHQATAVSLRPSRFGPEETRIREMYASRDRRRDERAQFARRRPHPPRDFHPPGEEEDEDPTSKRLEEGEAMDPRKDPRDPRHDIFRRDARERDPHEEARRRTHQRYEGDRVRRPEARSIDPKILSKVFLGRESPDNITFDLILTPDHVRFIYTVLSESRKKARQEAANKLAHAEARALAHSRGERSPPSESMLRELDALRREVGTLEDKLKEQQDYYEGQLQDMKLQASETEKQARKESERALRSYMKASIHALHRLQKND